MADNNRTAWTSSRTSRRDLIKALGDKAMSTVTDKVGGPHRQVRGHRRRRADRQGRRQGRRGGRRGRVAGRWRAQGRRVRRQGQDHRRRRRWQGRQQAHQGHQHHRDDRRRRTDPVAYNQWTSTTTFPSFMKKVENVDERTTRTPRSSSRPRSSCPTGSGKRRSLEQIPDERIVWKSKGEKGHVDGAVTFHELGPNLTRILVVLEYYPQGCSSGPATGGAPRADAPGWSSSTSAAT